MILKQTLKRCYLDLRNKNNSVCANQGYLEEHHVTFSCNTLYVCTTNEFSKLLSRENGNRSYLQFYVISFNKIVIKHQLSGGELSGTYHYVKTMSSGSYPSECQDGCSYTKDGDTSVHYCFSGSGSYSFTCNTGSPTTASSPSGLVSTACAS